MAVDLAQKRINWIRNGMFLLFGPHGNIPLAFGTTSNAFFQSAMLLQAWTQEGQAAGFIPVGQATATNPVVDADFASYPHIDAARFMAAVTSLESLNTDYVAVVASLVAIKP